MKFRVTVLSSLLLCCLVVSRVAAELPVEPIPAVEKLPAQYPATWFYAHDTNFFSLPDGKVVVLDVAADSRNYKGSIPSGQFPSFIAASTRPELYVAETVYSRRVRGKRTDLLTIYDKENLAPIAEILLPDGKRGQLVTHKNTLRFLNDEQLLLVFNFTPAASVSVIDIVKRKFLGEVSVAGCSMIYPSGKLSFASLCVDNTMLITRLDKKGRVKKQSKSKPFFNADQDPLFAKPARIGDMLYFPSFKGMIQVVDMSREVPVIGASWSMLNERDRRQNWRPGGWQIITGHEAGQRLFVLMHKDGFDGSHKQGGSEVWEFDAVSGTRLNRRVLKKWGVSIQVAQERTNPHLVVLNADMNLDVYLADSWRWQRMIGGRAFETPLILHAAN